LPEASAVAVATVVPLRVKVTVVPAPFALGVIDPETVKVGTDVAVNVETVTLALVTPAGALGGLNAKPDLEGVTV
jgi:hypothetical protein